MRKLAATIRMNPFHVVPIIFYREGLVADMLKEHTDWCDEHCIGDYAPDWPPNDGMIMLFENPADAVSYKMRWY